MLRGLSIFALLFGLVCLGISLLHILFGPASIPGSVPVNATMDSEDRFYATLLTGFALAMIWASRDLVARRAVFLALMATFFVGGLARLVSVLAVGWPSPLFIFLGSLELLIPPACWLVLRRALPPR